MTTGPSILIVDDDDLLCDMVAALLEIEGYQVTLAHDGVAGFALLEKGGFDLVLLDLVMPRMDGLQLMRKLADEMPDHPPIVVMSASVSAQILEEGRARGVAGMIRKPVEPDRLAAIVRAAIATRGG